MIFLGQKDRRFFDWLVSTEVFSKSEYNSWDKPEEGYLMSVLIDNHYKINHDLWINSGLKSNPSFLHIPNISVDHDFKNSFSSTLRKNLLNEYYISPICQHGNTKWFALGYFHPFNIQEFCTLLDLKPSNVVFNIVTPNYFTLKL